MKRGFIEVPEIFESINFIRYRAATINRSIFHG